MQFGFPISVLAEARGAALESAGAIVRNDAGGGTELSVVEKGLLQEPVDALAYSPIARVDEVFDHATVGEGDGAEVADGIVVVLGEARGVLPGLEAAAGRIGEVGGFRGKVGGEEAILGIVHPGLGSVDAEAVAVRVVGVGIGDGSVDANGDEATHRVVAVVDDGRGTATMSLAPLDVLPSSP